MMITGAHPRVSFVISTYNRRDILLRTIEQIDRCGLRRGEFEIIVIDNASLDNTAESVASHYPDVLVIALMRNLGACAKNIGIKRAKGEYVVFLDDDSYPHTGSIRTMIDHFEDQPELGAAVFTVTLPDGSRECCAYPSVFIGCGTGFRRAALLESGGLPADFFMAAEEYDLSLRLLEAGWEIQTFEDLHVTHLKTPSSREPWRLMRLDVRNNLLVATRFLPGSWSARFAADWMWRYYRIAAKRGQRSAFIVGLIQGALRSLQPGHRKPVSEAVFEHFTQMEQIEHRMAMAKEELGLRRVLFVDYGKNILPYWIAASKCGLKVVAIADNRLAQSGRYRGVPIVDDALARCMEFDAAIISNLSPVHAELRTQAWCELDRRPVVSLFETNPARRAAASAQRRSGLAA